MAGFCLQEETGKQLLPPNREFVLERQWAVKNGLAFRALIPSLRAQPLL